MSDQEYDLLDELYFVVSYTDLQKEVKMKDKELQKLLLTLIDRGWVLCFKAGTDTEVVPVHATFDQLASQYSYLASKKGLLAHNSI